MMKSRRFPIFALISLIAMLLSACSPAMATRPATGAAAPEAAPAEPAGEYGYAEDRGYAPQGKPQSAAPQRMVIRTANLNIIVDSPADSMAVVARMAEQMGGFVVAQNLYKSTGPNGTQYPQATITVRVPSERLAEAMDQIKAQVKDPDNDVVTENVSGQDVTSEYTDLRSRLRNLQAAEEQLREIMASAKKTEDVLAVQQQLTQVREQIEVIQGQIKYYEEAAALSSISVNLQARAAVQPLKVGGWEPVGVARDAIQSLIYAMQALGTVAIWGVFFLLPVGAVIVLPILLIAWAIRRGSRRRKAPLPPA